MAVEGAGGGGVNPNIQLVQPDTIGSPAQDITAGEGVVGTEGSYTHAQHIQKTQKAVDYLPEDMPKTMAFLGSVQDKSTRNDFGAPVMSMEKARVLASNHRRVVKKLSQHIDAIAAHLQSDAASAYQKLSLEKMRDGAEALERHSALKNSMQVNAAMATGN